MISRVCIALPVAALLLAGLHSPRASLSTWLPAISAGCRLRFARLSPRWIAIFALQGNPTVHVELLPKSEFRLFDRGLEHTTLVVTPDGRNGDFRRIIDVTGQYVVVVVNGVSTRRRPRSHCR